MGSAPQLQGMASIITALFEVKKGDSRFM
jgi:hypothetical protein